MVTAVRAALVAVTTVMTMKRTSITQQQRKHEDDNDNNNNYYKSMNNNNNCLNFLHKFNSFVEVFVMLNCYTFYSLRKNERENLSQRNF